MDQEPQFDDSILNNPETFQKHFAEIENRLNESENKFPVEVFPVAIQNIINQTNECLKFPVDFIGTSILFACSAVIGNTYKAEIKPGWVEGVTLYLALVGRAGTNKSHPLTFALQPIFDHDKKTFAEYKEAKAVYQRAMLQAKTEQTEIPEKPFWKKYIVNDFTPESLAEIHSFNLRGLGVYADELAGWFKNFNRYHKGSETEFWLSNFSGKQITIDRKSQEPVLIPTPAISVCGSIQTAILKELQKDNRGENGFIDRILFAMPENLQKEYWSEINLNPAIVESWAQIINTLLSLPMEVDEHGNPQPRILNCSPEAKEILKQWQRQNTDLCNNPENERLASIYSKFEIYIIRLVLILELMYWATGENTTNTISDKTANAAIALVEYFRKTAEKVNQIISNTSPVELLPLDKKQLYKSLPKQFTTEAGLSIANENEFHPRKFERLITDETLFEKIKHGEYRKKL